METYLYGFKRRREAPADFILRGYLGAEPIGLNLIDGYHLEVLRLKTLGTQLFAAGVGEGPG